VSETIKITRALVALKQRSAGLSGVDLAIRLGVNQPFMSRVLAGKRLPGRALAGQAQRAYGIPITWWDEEVSAKPADIEKTEAEIAAWFEKNPPPELAEVAPPGTFRGGDRVA